jgi:hypothetical protein
MKTKIRESLANLRVTKRNRRRHSVEICIKCDVIDPATDSRRAVTLSHGRADGFFPGVLRVRPHSAGGRRLCGEFNAGDQVKFDLGLNILTAGVAARASSAGSFWIHAVDVCNRLIGARCVVDYKEPFPPRGARQRVVSNRVDRRA